MACDEKFFECFARMVANAPETVLPSIVNSGFQTGELGVLKSVTIVAVHQEPLAIGRDVVLLVVGIG
jgi:hypothetical protein